MILFALVDILWLNIINSKWDGDMLDADHVASVSVETLRLAKKITRISRLILGHLRKNKMTTKHFPITNSLFVVTFSTVRAGIPRCFSSGMKASLTLICCKEHSKQIYRRAYGN